MGCIDVIIYFILTFVSVMLHLILVILACAFTGVGIGSIGCNRFDVAMVAMYLDDSWQAVMASNIAPPGDGWGID